MGPFAVAAAAVDSWHRMVAEAAVVVAAVADDGDDAGVEDDYADGVAVGTVDLAAFRAWEVAAVAVVAVVDLDSSCWSVGV